MINKKEFLLQSIIQAYIKELEPIGSSALKNMYGITYSPASIRGYFKKLGDEGYLAQEHASSGRTPTTEALKEYWANRLNIKLTDIDYDKLEKIADWLYKKLMPIFQSQQVVDVYTSKEYYQTNYVIKLDHQLITRL